MFVFKAKKIIVAIIVVAVLSIVGFAFSNRNEVNIKKGKIDLARMNLPVSALSGEHCTNAKARPMAVMISSDPETRPLSGIAEADMVFEMPVTDGGVTRMMAVFQCHEPKEIGSVRSARLDFIPLAQGLGAIYAHWGGEKEALAELSRGVINNLDGLQYDGSGAVYYRKKGVKPPHNGFTSSELLKAEMTKRGFGLTGSSVAYLHDVGQGGGSQEPSPLYAKEFEVKWKYNPTTGGYQRWRGGQLEIDANLNKAAEAQNVVIMQTTWMPINKDYIRVKTVGSGLATIYKNGQAIEGKWEKKGSKGKLFFYDLQSKEIEFRPGSIWVEIVTN